VVLELATNLVLKLAAEATGAESCMSTEGSGR
jgi:hypothetical protein